MQTNTWHGLSSFLSEEILILTHPLETNINQCPTGKYEPMIPRDPGGVDYSLGKKGGEKMCVIWIEWSRQLLQVLNSWVRCFLVVRAKTHVLTKNKQIARTSLLKIAYTLGIGEIYYRIKYEDKGKTEKW